MFRASRLVQAHSGCASLYLTTPAAARSIEIADQRRFAAMYARKVWKHLPMPKEVLIVSSVVIRRSPQDVFDFGASPQSWPTWHPTALSVSGIVDRPVRAGEEVFEQDRFAFLKGSIHWKVRHATAPTGWSYDGIVSGVPLAAGTRTSVTYVLSPAEGGTRLERTMTYSIPGAMGRFLDWLYFKGHNARQSQRAVETLKRLLEKR